MKYDPKWNFGVGDEVRVKMRLPDEKGRRKNLFQGRVIRIRGRDPNRTFTVRRIGAAGVGIEKIFPAGSPLITDVEVLRQGDPARSKLYYLRGRTWRKARIREKNT